MKKLKGLFNLLRFELPFSAGICVVMGQMLALGEFASITETIYGFLSVFFISASILVLNDYFDLETDKVNAPYRPIPSNAVTPAEALLLSVILVITGLILSYLLSFTSLIIVIFLLLIGFLYNRQFKKSGLPGNLMVSISVGMTFIYGGISVGLPFNKMIWFFGIIAALIDLGEEIAADSMDIKGDMLISSNSLAIKYGQQKAIKVSVAIFILVIILTILPFILAWFSVSYLLPILIMDLFIGYSSYKLLKSDGQEVRKYIRMLYLGATFGLVVFLIMRLLKVQ
jgi:geranylgeranylglycerol-phosphate geranylgeranyltransferase